MSDSKLTLGKATEYKVASLFLDAKCDVYLPAVDDHGVDMLVITPENFNDMQHAFRCETADSELQASAQKAAQMLYYAGQKGILEIQVKSLSTGGLFAAISCPKPRPNYFYLFYVRSLGVYWLIPSTEFVKIASQNSATCKNAYKYSLTLATGKGILRHTEYIIKKEK